MSTIPWTYSHLEGTENEVKRVENWLREKHDGLFRGVFINEADNELKIQCYCNTTFKVFLNSRKYFQSHFTTHKKSCERVLAKAKSAQCKKRSSEALENDFVTVLTTEVFDLPSNNLSGNLSLSKPSPLATVISQNIVGEVRIFSN